MIKLVNGFMKFSEARKYKNKSLKQFLSGIFFFFQVIFLSGMF